MLSSLKLSAWDVDRRFGANYSPKNELTESNLRLSKCTSYLELAQAGCEEQPQKLVY
jgi:hypothetical protein